MTWEWWLRRVVGGGQVSEGQGTGEGSAGHVENKLTAVVMAEERAWSQSCVECRSVMGMKAVGVCVWSDGRVYRAAVVQRSTGCHEKQGDPLCCRRCKRKTTAGL